MQHGTKIEVNEPVDVIYVHGHNNDVQFRSGLKIAAVHVLGHNNKVHTDELGHGKSDPALFAIIDKINVSGNANQVFNLHTKVVEVPGMANVFTHLYHEKRCNICSLNKFEES